MRTRRLNPTPFAALALAFAFGCGDAQTPPPPPAPSVEPPALPPPTTAAPAPPAPEPTAEEKKFAEVVIKVHKVAGNIFMLEGAGGNIGVSAGDDGIVIVDDQFAPLAPKIREALKGITDKPLRFVVNTHWHGDHTGGNAKFSTDATLVAHDNVRKRLVTGRPADASDPEDKGTPPAPKEALPVVTFNDKLSLHVNGEEVRALHFPSGHTDGDAVIFFTKSNVVHMGDDFVTYGFPYVDQPSGGTVKGLIAAMEKAAAELPPDVKVIPGHGPVSTIDDVKKLAATLRDCVKLIEADVKKKKTLDQIKKANPLAAKYADMGKNFVKADDFAELIFKELTAKPPAPNKAPAPAKPTAH